MRVTILTIGSHGDVLPCIALAKTLKSRGHAVRIAALEESKNEIVKNNIGYLYIHGNAKEVINLLIGKDVKALEYFRSLNRLLEPIEEIFFRDIELCCENTDVILYSVLGSIVYHVAQAKNILCVRMLFVPLDPTKEFPAMTAPIIGKNHIYNKVTYIISDYLWTKFTKKRLAKWINSLGLPPVSRFPYRISKNGIPIQTFYAFSNAVVPKPEDWKEHIHLTGYWLSDSFKEYQPTENLKKFLEDGEVPIYVGFGSMVGGDFKKLLSMVIEGIEKAGVRAVISSGWGGLTASDLPNTILPIEYIPHDWLFEKVCMVVHHGGAGTIAAGLRAGKPTIVVPFGGDQPFWGEQIFALGVGPKPLPIKKFTASRFSKLIKHVKENQLYLINAHLIKEQLICENGQENAALLLENMYASKNLTTAST